MLFAHNQIVPILLVTVLSVTAMAWVANSSLREHARNPFEVDSPTSSESGGSAEKNSCYKYLRNARAAGSSYWWQKYKNCVTAV